MAAMAGQSTLVRLRLDLELEPAWVLESMGRRCGSGASPVAMFHASQRFRSLVGTAAEGRTGQTDRRTDGETKGHHEVQPYILHQRDPN